MLRKNRNFLAVCVFLSCFSLNESMDNGLARTPPMGWMSWLKYACNVDCLNYPDECISERLFKDMIDKIAEDGWLELGYDTVNIDDCWSEFKRNPKTSRLVANRKRFPSGIRALSDYAKSKGVQLGIYSDVGTMTCQRYPGARDNHGNDYTVIDVQTFRSWNVTSLKLDGCYQTNNLMYNETYPSYSKALQKYAPKIMYACSWPAYLPVTKITPAEYELIRDNCNYWRNFDDIMDSWQSVLSIIDFYGKYGKIFKPYHGPGGWFDADMLIIGNNGLSYEQSKTQMAFWSLWSVPLLMSNDLRNIPKEMKEILMNKVLIRINQDSRGEMGLKIDKLTIAKKTEVWIKSIVHPHDKNSSAFAVIYFNREVIGVPEIMSYRLNQMITGLNDHDIFEVFDVFDNPSTSIGTFKAKSNLTLRVPTSGSVRMVLLLQANSNNNSTIFK